MNKLATENCQYGFPGNKKYLDFIQDEQITQCVQQLIAGVFGAHATGIISGCEVNGTNANTGIVLINGELLPFEGGVIPTPTAYVTTSETVEQAVFHDGQNHNAYKRRTAKFTTVATNTVAWSMLSKIDMKTVVVNIETLIADRVQKYPAKSGFQTIWFDTALARCDMGDMLYHHDDTVYYSLRGQLRMRQIPLASNQWHEVCDLNNVDASFDAKKLIPAFPNTRGRDIYFKGIRIDATGHTDILFRITGAGKWEVYETGNVFTSAAYIAINLTFANPPKL